jgi:hypothetical protein
VFGLIVYTYSSIRIYNSNNLDLVPAIGMLCGMIGCIIYAININTLGDIKHQYTSNTRDIKGIKVSYDSENTLKISYNTGLHNIVMFLVSDEPIIKSNKYFHISLEYLEQLASKINKERMLAFWRNIFLGSSKANYYKMIPLPNATPNTDTHFAQTKHRKCTSNVIIDGPSYGSNVLATCRVRVAIFNNNRYRAN